MEPLDHKISPAVQEYVNCSEELKAKFLEAVSLRRRAHEDFFPPFVPTHLTSPDDEQEYGVVMNSLFQECLAQ